MRHVDELPPGPERFGLDAPWTIAAPAEGQALYRITRETIPTVHDFLSNHDKHDPQRRGEYWLIYVGLSMFADRSQAEAVRDRFKRDQNVCEIRLIAGRGFMLARTRRTPGHYTVWGRPEDLLEVALDPEGYSGR